MDSKQLTKSNKDVISEYKKFLSTTSEEKKEKPVIKEQIEDGYDLWDSIVNDPQIDQAVGSMEQVVQQRVAEILEEEGVDDPEELFEEISSADEFEGTEVLMALLKAGKLY